MILLRHIFMLIVYILIVCQTLQAKDQLGGKNWPSLEQIQKLLEELAKQHPTKMQLTEAGKSV